MYTTRPIFQLALVALLLCSTVTLNAKETAAEDAAKEKELLAVLQSEAPEADKAITCKLLAIHGSTKAVPELAKLLPNPRLTSWARIALEAIPGPEADEALRDAAGKVEGRTLIGVLNSIGVRQDAQAVELLAGLVANKDEGVASAAAVSLGKVGNEEATTALLKSLANPGSPKIRSAVAEGIIRCAERRLADGNNAEAIKLYDELRHPELPKQRIIEATRGSILARGEEGLELLLALFESNDKKMFQLGLQTAREFPGSTVDQKLAEHLAKFPPERAALVIHALADRPKSVVLAAILNASGEGPKPVRLAALSALRKVGNETCLAALLAAAQESDSDLAAAAKGTLAELPGDKVNQQIVTMLKEAEGSKSFPVLIELVGQRRIQAIPSLLKALESSDKTVRLVTLKALGETVTPKELSVLITQVADPQQTQDEEIAQQALTALKAASVRMPDREACAAELTEAFVQSPANKTKVDLLKILGDVGGTTALQTIGSAAKSSDDELQDASTRLLGVWMTADAAPVLLDVAKTAPGKKYQTRAMRGYIRIARQFVLPAEERAVMCRNVLDSASKAERNMILSVLKRYPNQTMLEMALNSMEDQEISDQAAYAAMFIAQKLGDRKKAIRKKLDEAGLEPVDLEIIKAEYGSGQTQKDVTDRLRKQVGDWPVLILAKSTFNKSLGGDPAPGMTKHLKIHYKLNGKEGTVKIAENAPIVLPTP